MSKTSSSLRSQAKGRECQVRLPCCNHNPDTVVLAHVRLVGISGLGFKSPDLFGAWACSDCHDAVDRRRHTQMDFAIVRIAHFEGMMRTQNILLQEGKL